MNRPSIEELEKRVKHFNEKYKVGDTIVVKKTKFGNEVFITKIKYEACVLQGHSAVVYLENYGGYDVDFVSGKLIEP